MGRALARAVLVYDGDCPRCRARALLLQRRALAGGALEILPYRCGPRRERFPALDAAACAAAMHLVLPDGRMVTGAAAAPEVLRRLPFRGWLAGLASLPGGGAEWLARRLGLTCGSAEG